MVNIIAGAKKFNTGLWGGCWGEKPGAPVVICSYCKPAKMLQRELNLCLTETYIIKTYQQFYSLRFSSFCTNQNLCIQRNLAIKNN